MENMPTVQVEKKPVIEYDYSDSSFITHRYFDELRFTLNDDKLLKNLIDYLIFLKNNEFSAKHLISTILFQYTNILSSGAEGGCFPPLPEIYSKEPWRGHHLIMAIFTHGARLKQQVYREIDFWATVELKYL